MANQVRVSYVDDKGRTLTKAKVFPNRAVVICAGARTRYLKRLRVGDDFEYLPNFVVPAGGMLAIDITPPGYWERLSDGPVPEWAPAKLAQLTYAKVGPYTIAGASDPNGNGPGGQGVTPYWFDYRNCAEGRRAAATEMIGMMSRTPIDYRTPIDTDRYSLAMPTPPQGYGVDLDLARRWDPNCMDHLRFNRHDGQHLMRGYRAALALRDLGDRLAAWFCDLYLEHVRNAWGPKQITDTNTDTYWGVDQWLGSERLLKGLGREWAHVARLVWTLEPQGEFAAKLERMAHESGFPYFLNSSSGYAPWAREGAGGRFEKEEPIAMTREWMLGEEAMRLRPGLNDLRDKMLQLHDTRPMGAMNAAGEGYGNPNADYELFYNDLQRYSDEPANVLHVSSMRHPESGAMPMDSYPQRYWESAL